MLMTMNSLIKNINKWFHFAIVVQQLQVDLYYNGKLYNSSILESLPKYENDDIIICNDNGFAGLVYDFRIYYRPLVHSEIYTLSRSNPPISKKYFKDRY